jgi:putative transposase
MPRTARIVIPDCPHHVTQRGNNRQDVFFVDEDRQFFLNLLAESCQREGLLVQAYCLMSNHFHLVATPKRAQSLHLVFKRVGQLYTQYVNKLHGRSGHLWQDRFYSCPLDEPHYWTAMAYVERNPVRAALTGDACQWAWSSAAAHCGVSRPEALLDLKGWKTDPAQWRQALAQAQDERTMQGLRLCTSRGRPLGSDSFVSKLESLLGRRLRALPRGRPAKKAKK